MSKKKINIGLIGFGTVGQGFYELLKESAEYKKGEIALKVFDKQKKKTEILEEDIQASYLEEVAGEQTDIVVELTDDSNFAFEMAKKSLKEGKIFITANKKMIAENLSLLVELPGFDSKFFYEASVAGSIPIIKTIKNHYRSQNINIISGILNGSTNYILSYMTDNGVNFNTALAEAKKLGFAETNPWLDITGKDALYKSVILAYTAFGKIIDLSTLEFSGIENISLTDIEIAARKNQKIKLLAEIKNLDGEVKISLSPKAVGEDSLFYNIENETNAVLLENGSFGKQLFTGKGAGSLPTGSAVLSDLSIALENLTASHQIRRPVGVLSYH